MGGDIVKILVDEPEKISKGILRLIEVTLLTIVAEWFYRTWFGTYRLVRIGEFQDWADFVLSGRLLIVIVCMLIAKYVVHAIVLVLLLLLESLVLRRGKMKIEKEDIRNILAITNVAYFEEGQKIPRPGRNIKILTSLVQSFKNEKDLEEIDIQRSSLLHKVLGHYLLALVVYFTIIYPRFGHPFMLVSLIVGFIVLCYTYRIIVKFLDFMNDNHYEIAEGVNIIQSRSIVDNYFKRQFIRLNYLEERPGKEQYFDYRDTRYALLIAYNRKMINGFFSATYFSVLKQNGICLIIVANEELSDYIKSQKWGSEPFLLVRYESPTDLEQQLNNRAWEYVA